MAFLRSFSPLFSSVFGGADAIGESTLASGSVTMRSADLGQVSVSSGTVQTDAAATSTGGETPYASSYAGVESNADLLVSFSLTKEGSGSDGGDAWATSSTTMTYIALDFEGIAYPTRQLSLSQTITQDAEPNLSGNLAVSDADLTATARNSFTSLDLSTFTLADQFSTVSFFGQTAVDGSITYDLF